MDREVFTFAFFAVYRDRRPVKTYGSVQCTEEDMVKTRVQSLVIPYAAATITKMTYCALHTRPKELHRCVMTETHLFEHSVIIDTLKIISTGCDVDCESVCRANEFATCV